VLATGPLSLPKDPDFPGYSDFKGEKYQASRWPHHPVAFKGKRVGVIGTGSSGLQTITEVAKTVGRLTVFQRTPAFTAPAYNRPTTTEEFARQVADYPEYRRRMKDTFVGAYMYSSGKTSQECTPAEQSAILEDYWKVGGLGYVSAFNDVLFDEKANAIVADFLRERMGERIKDPVTRDKLLPRNYPIGARRPCCDSGYLETFNRDNVELVDLRTTPIVRFTATGIETTAGHHALDMVIVALGFDALSGSALAINPVNGNGQPLSAAWADGPVNYLGLAVAGYPNMFFVSGPGSSSVFANVPLIVEHDVDWIGDCIAWLKKNGKASIEAGPEAQRAWTAEVVAIGEGTLLARADSWYSGGNIPGKKRGIFAYMGGLNVYAARCKESADKGYEGFVVK
jgi:cyclohexanone monooxygenase